ncbi:MKK3 [Symbiodinium sp. CCMP2592]|nr:MKK3 [Symbiodinium sp. CCMP2592]
MASGAGIRTTPSGNLELATSLLAFFSTSGDTDGDRSIASALAPVAASTLILRLGHRSRPFKDGGGKPSPGRLKPEDRGKCKLAWLGRWIEKTFGNRSGPRRGAAPGQTSLSWTAVILQALVELAEDPELGNAPRDLEPPAPTTADNYPSAEVFEDTIEKTFLEEKLLDMVAGPLSEQEAADLCDCSVAELCVGAMAGIQELDKIRTIFDASVIGVNDNIRANTDKKTTAPTLYDLLFAWLHLASKDLTLFKSDVSKAHRRIKVLKKHWRYMVAKIKKKFWVNKVGTYGVFLWLLVFVDDFMAIMKESLGELGVNRWLGYMVNISEGSVSLPEEKLAILRPALLKLESGELHTKKEVTSLLGKLQWVAKAYPQVSSHLQPLYAWEQKLERKCRPGDLVRFLATLLVSILDSGPCVPLRLQHNTPCYGSSDAGEDDGRVAIGGWFSPSLNPTKAEVLWFSMDVLTTPWVQPLLAHTSPKRRIGALELLGTLILFLLAAESLGPSMIDAHLPLTTDNEGNAFSASKRSSKKWPCSALLMELSAQEFHKGVFAQVTHVKRSSNTWADQLTHFDFEGFSPGNRRDVSLSWSPSWMILDKLLAFKSEQ